MQKQVQSLTQHNCSLIALEGEDGSFTPLTASFGVILFAKPADTLYLEMWLCYVLRSLFIIAVSVLSLCRMLSGIFNRVRLKGNIA